MKRYKIQDPRFKIQTKFKTIFTIITAIFILYFSFSPVYAHKVSVYAYAEDGNIYAEGYFVDGSKAKHSLVEVFDAQTGEKLLEGKTGKDGVFSFKIPRVTPLRLVLHASMGHRNDYTVSEEEVKEAMGGQKTEIVEQEPVVKEINTDNKIELNSDKIEKVVEKAVEKKLQPIKNILLQIQEASTKPGITEVLGGIGYIMGIMGVVMYFKSKKTK